MEVIIPVTKKIEKEARHSSFQEAFPKTTKCCRCGGQSRLGFVTHELGEVQSNKDLRNQDYIYHLYKNAPKRKELWLHGACCVAIYFCKKCLEPTALYNQV